MFQLNFAINMFLSEIKVFKVASDKSFKQALNDFVEKHGLKQFQGSNAVVIADKKHVWRSWFKDDGFETFLKLIDGNQSIHLPKFLSRVREEPVSFSKLPKGTVIKFIKIENLDELQPSLLSDAIDTLGSLLHSNEKAGSVDAVLKLDLSKFIPRDSDATQEEVKSEIEKFRAFFNLILDLNSKHRFNDLNSSNVMMRGTIPVLTDPISRN